MKTEIHLKLELQRVQAHLHEGTVDGVQPDLLIPEMMQYIGSTDPELRDNLIYGTLCSWVERGMLSTDTIRRMMVMTLGNDHLFYRIGEQGTDSVFTRTFSALIIPLVIYMHGQQPFLSEAEIRMMKEKLIHYLTLEKDLRGYEDEKGWAHAAAHAADGLMALAGLQVMNRQDLQDMLSAIHDQVCISSYFYINGEDERLVNAAIAICKRNMLEDNVLLSWIYDIATVPLSGSMKEKETLRANTKQFLRSLYFKLLQEQELLKLTPYILERLNERKRY